MSTNVTEKPATSGERRGPWRVRSPHKRIVRLTRPPKEPRAVASRNGQGTAFGQSPASPNRSGSVDRQDIPLLPNGQIDYARLPTDLLPGRPVTMADVERFDRTREAVMRGRVFPDNSADLIHQSRLERWPDED